MDQKFKDQYNKLTGQILLNLSKIYTEENLVFSPYSIMLLLAITSNATSGKTREEILRALSGNTDYQQFINDICDLREYLEKPDILQSANAVLVNEKIKATITEGYGEQLKEHFDASLIVSANMATDVNTWVSEKTNGMIEKIADDSMNSMLACLINAIFFTDQWKEKYEANDIHEDEFVNIDGSISEVQMMSSEEKEYLENDFFTGFVKPYEGDYSFITLLPKKQKSKSFIIKALNNLNISELYRNREHVKTIVEIPEFEIDFKENITSLCQQMGIKQVLSSKADFSALSSERLTIESIIHEARIEVNRKGTKAAAATMAVMIAGCVPDFNRIKYVYLDRPFVYAIIDNKTGLPIFVGKVNNIS